jgi:predicted DNA-binding transcriptional regulator AlpA
VSDSVRIETRMPNLEEAQVQQRDRVCPEAPCPFIRVCEVAAMTLLSEREVWRRSRSDQTFPKPRKICPRVTVWMKLRSGSGRCP